ncbi:MAG: LAGLIDADG family homing endonuclease, partial [Ktedonobacteraceae bacterium]
GMYIALPRCLPNMSEPSMTDAELALLGHLIGDGCTLQRSALQYITGDSGLAERVTNLAREVFGSAVRPHTEQVQRATDHHPRYYVFLTSSEHLTHGKRNPVAAWLDALGVFNRRSYEKCVPEKVFTQSLTGIACFLRHLWSTDGCIHLDQGQKYYVNIYYASSSYQLAKDVQSLLLRLGINATLARCPRGKKGRDQYHVVVSGRSDILTFLTHIGGLGQSKVAHHALIDAYLDGRKANTNRDIVPAAIWEMFAVPAMQAAGIPTRQMQAALGNAYCGTALYKQNVSRERAARLARVVSSEPLEKLAQSDVYWDEIVSILPDEEIDVYDLTVAGSHNFVADNIIVHNSIENDADVVMFIYREEVYNTATERKNQADLIVAKQRNGPTGQAILYFDQAQSRFANLETAYDPESGEIAFAEEGAPEDGRREDWPEEDVETGDEGDDENR